MIADRLPRHLVLVVSNLVCGLTQAIAATLLLTDHASVGALVAIEAVNGASAAFIFPASAGLLPQTVPAGELQPANAIFRMFSTAAMVAGMSLGGVLVAGVGPGWGLAVDALSFVVAAACFATIRLAPAVRLPSRQRPHRPARGLVGVPVAHLALGRRARLQRHQRRARGGWFTLGPVIARPDFGRPGWGFVLAAETAGMFVCGLLLLRVRFRRPLFVGMLGMLAWSPLLLVLAAEPAVLVLVVASFLAGVAIELFGLGWDLSMQQHVPPHLLSRVYAYDALGSLVAIPVGQVLAGPLAAAVGVREAVALCAVVLMVVGAAATAVPAVRRLERTDRIGADAQAEHVTG